MSKIIEGETPVQKTDAYMSTIRLIEESDYHKGYKELFSTLTECSDLTEEEFASILADRKNAGWIMWVIEDVESDAPRIIGTLSLCFERKIYRSGKYVGHIEDVIVLPEFQNHNLGTRLNEYAINECQKYGCYKVILDCKPELENFYNKSGLKLSNIQMAKYF